MVVAWQADVPCQLDVGAPLDRVVSGDLGPVVHKVHQRFALMQRAVASVTKRESGIAVYVEVG